MGLNHKLKIRIGRVLVLGVFLFISNSDAKTQDVISL